MKKLNQKSVLVLTIFLIALCLFFIYQWNKEKNQSDHLNSITEQIVFREFTNLISELYYITDTLNMYNDNFTKQEVDLYTHSLNRSVITLNEINHNMSFLILHTTSLDRKNKDGILLRNLEEILGKVMQGEISGEDKIHSIGNVIRKQNDQLYNMFYGEEQIGVEGINTKEEMMKAIKIIDIMSVEIDGVVNK